jgi:hypothetical protein
MSNPETIPNEQCSCIVGPEWSGSPVNNDTAWECDECGRIIPCDEEGAKA